MVTFTLFPTRHGPSYGLRRFGLVLVDFLSGTTDVVTRLPTDVDALDTVDVILLCGEMGLYVV